MKAKSKKTHAIQQRLLNGKSGPQTEKHKGIPIHSKRGSTSYPFHEYNKKNVIDY